ncbi:unnamed protein product [Protopolystoma xenopodis]|uniref:Uncharacterized protein n=1 Tax=Protopolystoma xenopodis TaxID=117903 RepID=A0A448X0I2_9PLAT|nr:unnamed protein product [Protopolystoma xenopodis]
MVPRVSLPPRDRRVESQFAGVYKSRSGLELAHFILHLGSWKAELVTLQASVCLLFDLASARGHKPGDATMLAEDMQMALT